MHKAELLLCLASCLATGTAQATGVPFCGSGAAPTLSNCQDAVNKIDTTTSYSDGAEVDSGDCAIIFHNAGNGGGSATGADAQAAAQAIVNSCNAIGWEYDQNHNNVRQIPNASELAHTSADTISSPRYPCNSASCANTARAPPVQPRPPKR